MLTAASGTFSFLESQCIFPRWTVFSTQVRSGKPMFNPFINIFLKTKTGFSVFITHSSVNFTWFALFYHQWFDDRPLFQLGTLCLPESKFFFKIKVIFAVNKFQTKQSTFMEKNYLNNSPNLLNGQRIYDRSILSLKKILLFIE